MPDTYQRRPETELALSGGGFRAALFHIGGLWRLSEKLIEDFLPGAAKGTYWGINTRIADYELEAQNLGTPMVADNDATRSLSDMRTRLNKVLPRE